MSGGPPSRRSGVFSFAVRAELGARQTWTPCRRALSPSVTFWTPCRRALSPSVTFCWPCVIITA
jgi:hypothetical protein